MNWRHYLILFVIGLSVPFAISRFQHLPGYMDADYYFAGGVELAKGNGFTEPYLWNYLDDPKGLPHPSHTYWMPLASIISAIGMWLAGQTTYAAGRLPFILLSACVPLLTATLAFDITRNTRLAFVSGLLSIFSFFYAPFMPVPDNYATFMLLGGTFMLLAPRKQKWIPVVLGALAGLLTLARSDGLLWLGLAGLSVIWKAADQEDGTKTSFKEWLTLIIPAGSLVILGYLIVMGGWHYRSYTLFKSFMTPGGGRLLWLQNYNQTFSYPASNITREGFMQAGWNAAIEDRLLALGDNLNTAWIAQGLFFLFPFLLMGLWHLRKDFRTKLMVTGWLILFVVMTVIFPLAGARGSLFHAGAAFQMYWWVAIPIGTDIFLKVLQKRGSFRDRYAPYIFQGITVFAAIVATFYLVYSRVIAKPSNEDGVYASVEKIFIENGISPQVGVIVRNPPGYYISTGRPAIALPYGDESVIQQVAEKYGAGLLVLESGGTFDEIQKLYDHPDNTDVFTYLGEVDEAKLFIVNTEH
ncbi:MAG: hypothetical protein IPP66_17950 [Anaerolineales bacterium]|nr:hypothetical protein [Anaerolineales bacterium]